MLLGYHPNLTGLARLFVICLLSASPASCLHHASPQPGLPPNRIPLSVSAWPPASYHHFLYLEVSSPPCSLPCTFLKRATRLCCVYRGGPFPGCGEERGSGKVSYKRGQWHWVSFCFLLGGLTTWRMVVEETDTLKCMGYQISLLRGWDFCSLRP